MAFLPSNIGQAAAYTSAPGQPKEIGVMQRLDGVRSGVCEIEQQLRALISSLHGTPSQPGPVACEPGICGAISDAEAGHPRKPGVAPAAGRHLLTGV